MVFRKCTTLTWKIKIEFQGHSSVLLNFSKDLGNELKKLLEWALSTFINLRSGSKWDSFAQTDVYFGFIQIFEPNKFQFVSECFFYANWNFARRKKNAFYCLEKNVGLKKAFFTCIEFYFSKKRPNKTSKHISRSVLFVFLHELKLAREKSRKKNCSDKNLIRWMEFIPY